MCVNFMQPVKGQESFRFHLISFKNWPQSIKPQNVMIHAFNYLSNYSFFNTGAPHHREVCEKTHFSHLGIQKHCDCDFYLLSKDHAVI